MPAEISVTLLAAPVSNADVIPFADSVVGDAATLLTLVIENTGNKVLTIYTEVIKSGFRLISAPATSVAVGETTSAVISTHTEVPGVFSRTLILRTNDPLAQTFEVIFTSTVTSDEVVYTTRSLLERRYGYENVEAWADFTGARDYNAIEVAAYQTIVDASRYIDTYLRNGYYEVPFVEETIPSIIEQVCCDLVAYRLYQGRAGFTDKLDRLIGSGHRKATQILQEVRSGKLKLDALTTTRNFAVNTPVVLGD